MNQLWLDDPVFDSKFEISWISIRIVILRISELSTRCSKCSITWSHDLFDLWHMITWSCDTVLHHLTHLAVTWPWWFMYFVAFTEPFWLHLSFLFDLTFDVISRTYVTTWCLCGIFLNKYDVITITWASLKSSHDCQLMTSSQNLTQSNREHKLLFSKLLFLLNYLNY